MELTIGRFRQLNKVMKKRISFKEKACNEFITAIEEQFQEKSINYPAELIKKRPRIVFIYGKMPPHAACSMASSHNDSSIEAGFREGSIRETLRILNQKLN